MKLVTWNCNGAFRKKYHELAQLQADIYVVQECENPQHANGEYRRWAKNYLWTGVEGLSRGLGIFASSSIEILRLDWLDNGLQLFLPVTVNNSFNLVGIWTKHANSPTFRYVGQLWKYLELHKEKMAAGRTVLCGDLNSNKIWDLQHPLCNHSNVVRQLDAINMTSVYHAVSGEEQGVESSPTFYLHRNLEKPYHIDYAFASKDIFSIQYNTVSVGNHIDWLEFSDHLPLTFTIST